jgi:ubiquinone/menaquinone biosynthesis C-methylase UbiE
VEKAVYKTYAILNLKKKVLDIACGTGDIALELIKKNPSIELDLS